MTIFLLHFLLRVKPLRIDWQLFFLGTFINIKLDCLFRNQYTSWVKMFKLKKECNLYAELTQLIVTI